MGVGGVLISVAKLVLYTACAGMADPSFWPSLMSELAKASTLTAPYRSFWMWERRTNICKMMSCIWACDVRELVEISMTSS